MGHGSNFLMLIGDVDTEHHEAESSLSYVRTREKNDSDVPVWGEFAWASLGPLITLNKFITGLGYVNIPGNWKLYIHLSELFYWMVMPLLRQ